MLQVPVESPTINLFPLGWKARAVISSDT